MIGIRLPTLARCSRSAIPFCVSMNRRLRSAFTSGGTRSPSALAGAPATGSCFEPPARPGLVFEAADAIELGLLQPGQQLLKLGLGLAGEADDEGRADREVRADLPP